MGKKCDLSPRKLGQIQVLLSDTPLKQREIARKLGVSTQTISVIKKKIDSGVDLASKRVAKCGRKRKTTPRTDRQIVKMALKDRRRTCRNLSTELAVEGISLSRRRVNARLLESGLKAYRPRKKPRLTQPMIKARLAWAKDHVNWTSEQWEKVRMILAY